MKRTILCLAALVLLAMPGFAQKKKSTKAEKKKDVFSSETLAGLSFRNIGPAFNSGRISHMAVNPNNKNQYYVAAASGGVWKTDNFGTTWTPIFDGEGSYSIGCVSLDPANPNVVWVGTGENNSQRSVGYGDGVYKSLDGGANWKHMGLKQSEHIARIVIDPRDSSVVFVASQGPLWSKGGERGVYKSINGGESWELVLEIDEHTGVTDLVYDRRNPDVMYAASYQRRRHVWTLIDGGPGSSIYKSTNAGSTWRKIDKGLPTGEIGRIGLAIGQDNPDLLYAIVEATEDKSGLYASTNGGERWEKRSDYVSGSPQYYQEIYVSPHNDMEIYSLDTFLHRSTDGGRSFEMVGERWKHVDNHAIAFDKDDPNFLRLGCDGGLYETWDRGATWFFRDNLPVTQFYRVGIDNDSPFYNVYGGTQDNFTIGLPSRTLTTQGITNREAFITVGGDGFQPRVDPEDPNIVYCEYQYGGLARYDRKSGERVYLRPFPGPDEPPLRFNWDAPLIISPHSHTRLYFAANILFRSDDRGNTWKAVSPDLTLQLDRNQLPVMDKIQPIGAVAKSRSTSLYGNIVALDESPLKEGLLLVGTDDGLVQISEDGGRNWHKIASVPGVPARTYVNDLHASRHEVNTLYAAFNNHKMGDFKPYLFKSSDLGRTWTSIGGMLPERGSVYAVLEDPVKQGLLFAGTEFGVFVSIDDGATWAELTGGMPTVGVRDMEIQARESDLVLASFGRGFFILDDFSPLRSVSREMLEKEQVLFAVKDAWQYVPSTPLGRQGNGFLGDGMYRAPNPPFGAIFTYYLPESLKSRKAKREDAEKEAYKDGKTPAYPDWDTLRQEERESEPAVWLVVRDGDGNLVRQLKGAVSKGFHRIDWDLRYPPISPTSLKPPPKPSAYSDEDQGPMVVPGTYAVTLHVRHEGTFTQIGEAQPFQVKPLGAATLDAEDKAALTEFARKTGELYRAIAGAQQVMRDGLDRIKHLKRAAMDTPADNLSIQSRLDALAHRLDDLSIQLNGDRLISSHSEPYPPSISDRVEEIIFGHWYATQDPTQTQRDNYHFAAEAFAKLLPQLRQLVQEDLATIEGELEKQGAPYTPGRFPHWEGP